MLYIFYTHVSNVCVRSHISQALYKNRVANVKIIEECPRGLTFNIRWPPVNAVADDHEVKDIDL